MANYYKNFSRGRWTIGIIIAVIMVPLAWGYFQGGSVRKTTREIALSCTTDMFTKFHIHPKLEIIINGQRQEIPANIGVSPICMHPLHTHDAVGKIHVESPEQRDFTLDDFFAVWGKTFNRNQILDYKVDDTHVIIETVNGIEVQTFENTVLRDEDSIVISYVTKR